MDLNRFMEQVNSATNRYYANVKQLKKNKANLKAGKWEMVDEPARITRRMLSKGMVDLVGEMVAAAEGKKKLDFNPFERIIGDDDLMTVTYLYQGAAVARSVGRVAIRSMSGRITGFGTGFMVSSQLLMTNNHVLYDRSVAQHSTIQFDYWEDPKGRAGEMEEYHFQPNLFFQTNSELDFTLVSVEPVNQRGKSVARRGWSPFIAESGKSLIGEPVTIIQHPGGEPQQVVLPENKITTIVDNFIHYDADTQQGSSGSAVFNKDWELAALHHAGVTAKDDQGRILLIDNSPWNGGADTIGQIKWIANEGVRISRIVSWLKSRENTFTLQQRKLFKMAFEPRPEFEQVLSFNGSEDLQPLYENYHRGRIAAHFDKQRGIASWIIPVSMSVEVSSGEGTSLTQAGTSQLQFPPIVSEPQVPKTIPSDMTEHSDYQEAIEALSEFADRPYLDENDDEKKCYNYYIELPWALTGKNLYRALHRLLVDSHKTKPKYRQAKLKYLYPWVDLVEATGNRRELRSIYSGKGFDPLELLSLEFDIEMQREAMIRERFGTESLANEELMLEALEELEAQLPYNCEHVVCQSWFNRKEPMRGDLHHLFTCESGCNSFRSNVPYWQFPLEEEKVRPACGERVADKFEPNTGKGAVARATLYFLLRYPNLIGERSAELTVDRLNILLDWHNDFPPDRYERHRNAAIFEIQGNRNPLIDYPEWAANADFREGFASFA